MKLQAIFSIIFTVFDVRYWLRCSYYVVNNIMLTKMLYVTDGETCADRYLI
jgi:hypothetical protein